MINNGKTWGRVFFWIFLLWNIFLPRGFAFAAEPVQVTATVDRNEMGVGDTFTYTVEVSSKSSLNTADPKLPTLQGLELINQWSGVESRSTYANGTFESIQSRQFNYMFATTKPGTFTIGAAHVLVGGQNYSTQPISIKVLPGKVAPPQAQQNQPPDSFEEVEDIFNQLLRRRLGQNGMGGTRGQPINPDEAFFIQVEVDKEKVYVGEQVTASWYLYTRGQILDIDTLKYPSLSGFWKEEIELATRLNFQQEVINGVAYQKALLASYALFPIKPGTVTIDAYKAKCTVTVPSQFGFGRPYVFTKVSKAIPLQVMDVPTQNRPTNFTGAVGQFTAKATVAATNVAAHQPLSLKLKFEGRGNAKLIDLPALNFPSSVEIYDTKSEAKFFREGNSYKDFEIVMIPRQAGALVLPSIEISAFDPTTAKFYPVKTQPITLNVLPGVAPATGQPLAMENGKTSAKAKGPALPGLAATWQTAGGTSWLPTWTLWTLLYALVLAILAWRLVASGELFQQRQNLNKLVKKRLEVVQAAIDKGDWRRVGVEGTNLLYFVLGRLSTQGGAGQEIDKLLLDLPPSVRRELTEAAKRLLQTLELLSFAPENLVGERKNKPALKSLYKELSQLSFRAASLTNLEINDEKNESVST